MGPLPGALKWRLFLAKSVATDADTILTDDLAFGVTSIAFPCSVKKHWFVRRESATNKG